MADNIKRFQAGRDAAIRGDRRYKRYSADWLEGYDSVEQPPKKIGRPKGSGLVITQEKQKEIFAVLAIGGSRNDAADYVGVGRSTLHNYIEQYPEFSEQIKKAEMAGKIKHMKKVGNAQAWQASAWMLERKYPEDWGVKQKIEHSGEINMAEAMLKLANSLPN